MANIFSNNKNKTEIDLTNFAGSDKNSKNTNENEHALDSKIDSDQNKPKKSSKININKYHDPEGLTVNKMAFGLWLLRNRKHFKFIFVVFLGCIIALTWPKFIYTFGHYIVIGMKDDQRMLVEMAQTSIPSHQYFLAKSAQNLIDSEQQLFANENNLMDFFTKVKNPNSEYIAKFNYYFQTNTQEITEKFSGYILPNEEKYFMVLGQEMNQRPSNFSIVFEDLNWERINKHKYPDWNKFYNEHVQFNINDLSFTHAKESLLTEKYSLNELKFTIENDSSYNYWQTGFIILLRDKNLNIIAINKQLIEKFMAGEIRNVDVTWPGKFTSIGNVTVIPDVDITDQDNYMKFTIGSTVEK